MFKTTLIGILVAFGTILAGQLMEGSQLGMLIQPTAFLIVFGGTLGAVLIQSSPADLKQSVQLLSWLSAPDNHGRGSVVKEMADLAKIAYRDGLLSLDKLTASVKDPWVRQGLEMAVDKLDPEFIRETLTMELRVRDARARSAIKVWEAGAGYAPTIGILGSVMGLLHIMSTLNSADSIGAGLAVAFVATFYGLGLANLVLLPIANKLKSILFEQTLQDEMRLEAIIMIAENKKPALVQKTMDSFGTIGNNVVSLRRAA